MARGTLWLVMACAACSAPQPPLIAIGAPGASPAAATPARPAPYPAPQADFPRDRLDERVDGAAELLRRTGCQRLLYWRLENPPADLELLLFSDARGALEALGRDAGQDRSPASPGEEGWLGPQCVFFRRGSSYVRLIADQSAGMEALTAQAARLDDALVRGEFRLRP